MESPRPTDKSSLGLLYELSSAVSRAETLEEVFDRAMDGILAALRTDRAAVLLFDPDEVMRFKAWRGLSDSYRRAVEGHTPWKRETKDPQTIVVEDVESPPELASYIPVFRSEQIRALAFVPLVYGGEVLGKFMLYFREPRSLSREEVQLGSAIAAHAALAVGRIEGLRALRESEERFVAFISRSPALKYIKDEDGRYLFVNPAVEATQGWQREDWLGRTDFDLLPHDMAQQIRENDLLVLRGNESKEILETLVVASGEERHFLSIKFPLVYGGRRCLGGTSFDVTAQKRADEALKREAKLKDDFLAMLAHELRNPLSPIRNAAQLLKMIELKDPMLVWIQEVLERQTGHLTRLVDDLLDVSRIVRGRIVLEKAPVDLSTVISHAVEANRPFIEEKKQTLTMEVSSGHVLGDFTRLAQVVSNLLNNAAKYTGPGGHIWTTVTREGDEFHVRIRDTGMGISRQLLPFVFELFTQDSRALDRSEGGLGIGLTVARNLVELHGGTITAHSPGQGMGSEFVVKLPAMKEAFHGVSHPAERGASPIRSRRVLVVDDNADAAHMLAFSLEKSGHTVKSVFSHQQAFQAFEEFSPDVVLLDIGLPEMDGYKIARRLRELPGGKEILLLAVTGYGQEEDKRRSMEAGFDFHLTKPVRLENIEALMSGSSAN